MKTEKYKKLQKAIRKDYKNNQTYFSFFHPCNNLTVLNSEFLEIEESSKKLNICSLSGIRS